MNNPAWMILTTGLADGYELTKSPARVQAAKKDGQTVIELVPKPSDTELLEFLDNPVFSFESMQKRWMETQ